MLVMILKPTMRRARLPFCRKPQTPSRTHTQTERHIHMYACTLQQTLVDMSCVSPKSPQRIKWHALLFRFVCISEGGSTAEGYQEILTYIKLRFEKKGWWSRFRWRVLAARLHGCLVAWLTVWWSVWVLVTCFAFLMRHSNTHTHTQGCTPLFCLCACDRTICQNTKQQE